MQNYQNKSKEYFLNLVKFGTDADPEGLPEPTLKRFMKCAEYIAQELRAMGIEDVEITEQAYVYATIPSNVDHKIYTIGLMAHYDTALENPGEGINPIVHENYQGGDLKLPNQGTTISSEDLKKQIGNDIITSSGDTLLGADDKAGIAEILDLANYLMQNPEIKRPTLKLVFNNNEEVGRGVDHLDYEKLEMDYAYNLDGGEVGSVFVENFNADGADITVTGVTVHPGYAKDKMVNALLVGNEIVSILNEKFLTPEKSEGREPYLGLKAINGTWTEAKLSYLLRGFDMENNEEMKAAIDEVLASMREKYPAAKFEVEYDEVHIYRNAGEILKAHPLVNGLAEKAYAKLEIEIVPDLTRGGFDGVRMSFDGVPTTNLFNGAINWHGLTEFVSVQDMELATKMLVELVQLWAEETKE